MRNKTLLFLAVLVTGLLPACFKRSVVRPLPTTIPSQALRVVPPEEIPEFADDMDDASLEAGIEQSLAYYEDIPRSAKVLFGEDVYTVSSLRKSLKKFRRMIRRSKTPAERGAALRKDFIVYQSTGSVPGGNVIFSAYCEHSLPASFTRRGEYIHPLYARPPDLDETKPYYTREEIDSKEALKGRNLEIAWAKDPFDIYLLQVEGSGWLEIDGSTNTVRIRYAGSNNRPYHSVGLTSYLNARPGQRQEILNTNARYIFFRLDTGPEAPWALGSLLVPLTPGRSVATDPMLFPRGALGWIKTGLPKPVSRFVLNQDEGGAIKGPARLDLFVGGDEEATRFANRFWQAGQLYFIVLKP